MSVAQGPALGFGDDPNTEINIWFRSVNNGETVTLRYADDLALSVNVDATNTHVVNTAVDDGTHVFNLTGLTAGKTYYYRLEGDGGSGNSSTEIFRPLPSSMLGETVIWSSCFSNSTPDTSNGALFAYAKDTLSASAFFMIGDITYSELVNSIGWNPDVDATDPTVAHYQEHHQDNFALADYAHCAANIPCSYVPSDHDVMNNWPDNDAGHVAYQPLGQADDPTDYGAGGAGGCYDNATTVIAQYVESYASVSNSGALRYGSFTIGDYIFAVMDSRTHRKRDAGQMLGEVQKAWLFDIFDNATSDQTCLVFSGDTFAGTDALNGDGWESNTTSAGSGYIAERDLVDAVASRSKAKIVFFGGDSHAGTAVITKGGNYAFGASPVEQANFQRTPTSGVTRMISEGLFFSGNVSPDEDNRMGAISFNSDGTLNVSIIAAHAGGDDVIDPSQYSVTI